MSKPIKLLLTLSAATTALMVCAPTVFAQDADEIIDQTIGQTLEEPMEEIVATGFRSTLQKARDMKRYADIVQDSIVAEDIASFPDLNLAESLQRLPGVAINREAGEGRRVTLRGLGPDFTRVQLNGMEVLGNVDSPQDSRGQTTRDRAFDFNIFASELFTRVDVRKSYSAEQDEGGIAGTVGLYTAKPFDYDGFEAGASFQGGTNTATKDLQPRMAGLISNNWGNFGALLSVAYSERETEEQGYNTYRWRPRTSQGSDISGLTTAEQTAIESGELYFARGNRLSVWQSSQKRLGITGALQWAPSENIELTLDVLHGRFEGDRDEFHIASRGSSSTWLGGGTYAGGVEFPDSVINEIQYNENNEVVYLDVSGANIATETRRQETKNVFNQMALSGEWKVSDKLLVEALIGTETSDYEIPISDKFYLQAFNDVISDYTQDSFYGQNTYGFDTTDAANWGAHEIDFREDYQSSSFDNAKVDFTYDLNDISRLEFGGSFRSFANSGYRLQSDNLLWAEFLYGTVDDDISAYASVFSGHDDQDWATVDFDTALDVLGVTRDAGEIKAGTDYTIQEDTLASYLQYAWSDLDVFGLPVRGNIGLRYFQTETESEGDLNEGRTTLEGEYDGVLPSLNAAVDLNEDVILRFAASKNINRPSLGSLAINAGVYLNDEEELVVESGNPDLEPYESINLDASAEWYFGDVGTLSLGVFYKDIDGYISTETITNIAYSETGLPLTALSGLTADSNVVEYSRPVNLDRTDITGVEINAQTDLAFLPAPFNKLGVTGNLTLVDSSFNYGTDEEPSYFSLEGLSDTTANITVYYEDESWGARVSSNYRSDYIQRGTPVGSDDDSAGFNATTYVDFAAYYELNEHLKFTFDAINLTNEREEQYSDSSHRLYNSTTAGTTFFGGVSYKY